jgi:hypothetical protein
VHELCVGRAGLCQQNVDAWARCWHGRDSGRHLDGIEHAYTSRHTHLVALSGRSVVVRKGGCRVVVVLVVSEVVVDCRVGEELFLRT